MQAPKIRHYSVNEYFTFDEAAPEGVRLEFDEGVIYLNGQPFDPDWGWDAARPLAGAHPEHNLVKDRLARLLGNTLDERGCHVLTSDQQLAVSDAEYSYPDVVVACSPKYDGIRLLNPELIVEVLSKSTAERDLRQKLQRYQQIASLMEYWVVSTAEVSVTRYKRMRDGWAVESCTRREDEIRSEQLIVAIDLNEVYRGL